MHTLKHSYLYKWTEKHFMFLKTCILHVMLEHGVSSIHAPLSDAQWK
uniref:Uncharacterized protein n=1 Tax=Arundo donax TaxID=35708 RepID=A0A0A9H6N6_ARUDO